MNFVKRESKCSDRRPARWLGLLAGILALTSAACARGGVSDAQMYSPPPPLSLVAILDPSPDRLAGAAQQPLVLVAKAPAGPPPPALVRLPTLPANPTDFQRAQYKRGVESANTTNAARIASWQAAAAKATEPWQHEVAAQLNAKAG